MGRPRRRARSSLPAAAAPAPAAEAASASAASASPREPPTPPRAGCKRQLRSRSGSPIAKRTRRQRSRWVAQRALLERPAGEAARGPSGRNGHSTPGASARASAGPGAVRRLLDLPPELRLLILEQCTPYREVARLRSVCSAFNDSCGQVVRTGFLRMQEQLQRHVTMLERQAEALLVAATNAAGCLTGGPPASALCTARRTLQRNLQRQTQLRLLAFQMQMVRALTWRYVEAGVVAPPYAALLDACDTLLHGSERGPTRPRTHVFTCRNAAMRLLKNFLKLVQERLPPTPLQPEGLEDAGGTLAPALAPQQIVLPCSCVVDLLETSLGPAPASQRCRVSFRPIGSHTVRVQTRYDLEGCWLGVYSGARPHGALRAEDIHLLSSILCDLVCSSCEAGLLGLREGNTEDSAGATADDLHKTPGYPRGRPPFCVYPRLHNPRQGYRASIREPSGRVFAFGHALGERTGLRVFLDLRATMALIPASLLRRLAPATAARLATAPAAPAPAPAPAHSLAASASEPSISTAGPDEEPRSMPFQLELVLESNAERVTYNSNA